VSQYIVQGEPFKPSTSGNLVTLTTVVRSACVNTRSKRQSKRICVMEQYTPSQRAVIVQLYIQNNFSIVKTQRACRAKYRESREKNAFRPYH